MAITKIASNLVANTVVTGLLTTADLEMKILSSASAGDFSTLSNLIQALAPAQKEALSPDKLGMALNMLTQSDSAAAAGAIRNFMEKFSTYLPVDNRLTGNVDIIDAITNLAYKGRFDAMDAITDNMSAVQKSAVTYAGHSTVTYHLTKQIEAQILSTGSATTAIAALEDYNEKMAAVYKPVAETKVGTDLNDVFYVDTTNDAVTTAGAGVDTVVSAVNFGANTAGLINTLENIVLVGKAYSAYGSDLNNTILGNAAANVLLGLGGNDVIRGGAGDDIIYGGNGFLSPNVPVTDDDKLYGDAGNDTLYGEAGNDVLDGGVGDDKLVGGAGNDTYFVDSFSDTIVEYANQGIDKVVSSFDFGANTVEYNNSIEDIQLVGTAKMAVGNDMANQITGNIEDNMLIGLGGNDTLFAAAGDDYAYGDQGNDKLYGQSGNDTLYGGSGNDELDGGVGRDVMLGGSGNDSYSVDDINDEIVELVNDGTDTVYSAINFSANTEALHNTIENITLVGVAMAAEGNELNNVIIGDAVNNTINGLGGNDRLFGGLGDDVIVGGASAAVAGQTDNDVIYGEGGEDFLFGAVGNDILIGGAGNDTLWGEAGADVFKFDVATLGTVDMVMDFSLAEGDKLDFKDILVGFDAVTKAISDFVQITTVGNDSIVSVDRDGAGTLYKFQQVADVTGVTGLTDEQSLLSKGYIVA